MFSSFSGILLGLKVAYTSIYQLYGPISARFNPFKLEFTIVIFIHYKPRISVAILDL